LIAGRIDMDFLYSGAILIAIFGPPLLGVAYLIWAIFFNGGKGVFNTLKDHGDIDPGI
jgi:hypothetical protein